MARTLHSKMLAQCVALIGVAEQSALSKFRYDVINKGVDTFRRHRRKDGETIDNA